MAKRQLNLITHRIHTLPVLVLMPHSSCNCRCVMCDIWKANQTQQQLSPAILQAHLALFQKWGVRWVTLSGGEPLLHKNLWDFCQLLKSLKIKITLLSTGLLLQRHAESVVRWCDEVIVSLDGSREIHNRIRNIPNAYDKLAAGVAALRHIHPDFRVTGRTVLQQQNFRDLPEIIRSAHAIGLDQISFLAADVSTEAFNRPELWDEERSAIVALCPAEVPEFANIVEQVIADFAPDFECRYIAESPDKLRQLPRYYGALLGQNPFPPVTCNAPWVSAVIEAGGTVRPCFFHPSLGNIHDAPLDEILNHETAIQFRKHLQTGADPICEKCVCSLNLGIRTAL